MGASVINVYDSEDDSEVNTDDDSEDDSELNTDDDSEDDGDLVSSGNYTHVEILTGNS